MGPQVEAITATWCPELLFGGARGGGKSDFLLGDYLQDVHTYGRHWQGIIFRRTLPELEQLRNRSATIYPATGGVWRASSNTWVWPNGAKLLMRYLERPQDATRYQGHQYSWIGWDELTQWASSKAYKELTACLRWAEADVKTKRIRCTANPGGAGHQWVKNRFIDPNPAGFMPIWDEETKSYRMFIPSKVVDNRILLASDPYYIARLQGVGSPELVRMWLEGDWNVVAGSYFPEFRTSLHVVAPERLPEHWTRFRALDWGSARPHCNLWFAVSDGTHKYPKGALIVYREDYGASEPNVGLKLTVEQVAKRILAKEERGERIDYSKADPAIFKADGGESFYERFRKCGLTYAPADNQRLPGWNMVRARLLGEDDRPMLYIFSTCTNLIRTLPALQHDDRRIEDVDTDGEDHAADALRYGVMSRPYTRPLVKPEPIKGIEAATINELWKYTRQQREVSY